MNRPASRVRSVKDLGDFGAFSYGFDWYHDEIDSSRTDVDASVSPPDVTHRAGGVFRMTPTTHVTACFSIGTCGSPSELLATTGVRYEHVTAGATVTANNVTGKIDPGVSGLDQPRGPDLRSQLESSLRRLHQRGLSSAKHR